MKMENKQRLIRNWDLANQRLDFTGLQNGAIHPSDIDGILEYDNEILILFEVKRSGCEIPTGQRLVLQRIADRWGEKAVVIFATHDYDDPKTDIPAELCSVEMIYNNKKWRKIKGLNLIDALNKLGQHWNCDKLKF